jgi:hypothetical protein
MVSSRERILTWHSRSAVRPLCKRAAGRWIFSAGFAAFKERRSDASRELLPSNFTKLWRKVQDVQNKVAEDSIEKRVTQEKSPPQVGTSAPDVDSGKIEKAHNYESGKCQYVGNPVTNRAVRPQFVNQIKTFGSSTSEDNTQDDSCGNPQNKVPVVSILHRQFSLKVAAG